MKVIILDSGLDNKYRLSFNSFDGYGVLYKDNFYSMCEDYNDELGHGTMVTDIFLNNIKTTKNLELTIIKVGCNDGFIRYSDICYAFDFILTNIQCAILLISAGIRVNDNYNTLHDYIKKINNKKIIIVSAFDNYGAISYPAAFDKVIGVDVTDNLFKKEQFILLENSIVDIMGANCFFRTSENYLKKKIVKGSSFYAAYIAALIFNILTENSYEIDLHEIKEELKRYSLKVKQIYRYKSRSKFDFSNEINKAIIFPFNKEVQTLALNEDLISFNIEYYDTKYKGITSKKIKEILPLYYNNKVINDYACIDWENKEFDTFILSHIDYLNKLIGKDYTSEIIKLCKKYNKKIYSFSNISDICRKYNFNNYYFPKIDKSNIPKKNLGKLHLSNVPVLGIYGTSSKQGKFKLQLDLRRMFLKDGYKVAQITTEPSGFLFGCDEVYPIGYESTVYIKGNDTIATLNEMIYRCEAKNPDIIITGSQSGTIPYVNYNLKYMTNYQSDFILGTLPDLVILMVNYFDNIDYISRTIKFLQGICNCKVIAIVVFPYIYGIAMNELKTKVEENKIERFSQNIFNKLKIKVFILNTNKYLDNLYEEIINSLV